ncbi:MAG: class I SAM-dependent methyltransferase [Candidatus Marithrix sp.]
MKNITCPFCDSKNIEEVKAIISPFNQKNYKLVNCVDCELQFFTPLIFDKNIYENEIINEYADFHKGRVVFPPWTKEVIRSLKNLSINLNDRKILEVGAGDGINYTALNKICFIKPKNYYVVEFDSKSVEQCRKRGIINIITSIFDQSTAAKFQHKFDVILLLEVLEYQINPKQFINSVFNLLNEDGLVVITVPNRERFFSTTLKFKEIYHLITFYALIKLFLGKILLILYTM